eukprot:CAMPEP_0206148422 /NCGR_PEP_ID=MMETSP1473-20131121/36593_1 /ASSEMBLY_ACC=CAM_ASM_001109 /TAXON_ID=1461547 /ORGANISM="Stichococcus sp, Strain RCC1054" /LENGTH=39 /DNA_ID= /DNA_START= /DNA_END= /DNA_ORIENTATION=
MKRKPRAQSHARNASRRGSAERPLNILNELTSATAALSL